MPRKNEGTAVYTGLSRTFDCLFSAPNIFRYIQRLAQDRTARATDGEEWMQKAQVTGVCFDRDVLLLKFIMWSLSSLLIAKLLVALFANCAGPRCHNPAGNPHAFPALAGPALPQLAGHQLTHAEFGCSGFGKSSVTRKDVSIHCFYKTQKSCSLVDMEALLRQC